MIFLTFDPAAARPVTVCLQCSVFALVALMPPSQKVQSTLIGHLKVEKW